MGTVEPEAYFDTLAIMHDAPASALPMSVNEMHLFSYLACILALFRGKPVAEWGYRYAVTSEGFPFSAQFERARQISYSSGLIEVDDEGKMSPRRAKLSRELDVVLEIGPWAERRPWLRAATDCSLALPMGSIRHAVNRSPGMLQALQLGQRQHLLQPADETLLYEEYEVVNAALGENIHDLLSPAVIWLSARVLRGDHVDA